MRCGLFGKLPARRDFVSIGGSRAFVQAWEQWLQPAVAASKNQLGPEWLGHYLRAPLWRFWLGRDLFGAQTAGVLMPSMDGVGRHFPLTVVTVAGAGEGIDPPWLGRGSRTAAAQASHDLAHGGPEAGDEAVATKPAVRPGAALVNQDGADDRAEADVMVRDGGAGAGDDAEEGAPLAAPSAGPSAFNTARGPDAPIVDDPWYALAEDFLLSALDVGDMEFEAVTAQLAALPPCRLNARPEGQAPWRSIRGGVFLGMDALDDDVDGSVHDPRLGAMINTVKAAGVSRAIERSSLWWSIGGGGRGPMALWTEGFPEPETFSLFLTGRPDDAKP
jgi:type VI secretion system ImpM family protein